MAKIEQFNKQTCKTLHDDIMKAIESVGEKLGVKLEYRGGKYTDTSFTLKIEAVLAQGEGASKHEERKKTIWSLYAKQYGLKDSDFGKTFKDGKGLTHTIIEFNPRKPKNPIVTQGSDGRRWVWPPAVVKSLLEK